MKDKSVFWLNQIKDKYIIGGDESFDQQRKDAIDEAIKALETVDKIKAYIKKHNSLDSLELLCIIDIINGECEE